VAAGSAVVGGLAAADYNYIRKGNTHLQFDPSNGGAILMPIISPILPGDDDSFNPDDDTEAPQGTPTEFIPSGATPSPRKPDPNCKDDKPESEPPQDTPEWWKWFWQRRRPPI
jgi:hypothetical protein